MATTTSYPSDVSDEEWAVAVPYLTLLAPSALQRKYDLRAVFNAVRYLAPTGAPWRYLPSDFPPSDFPPWPVVYQQVRRWLAAGSFEALVHDTRLLLRTLKGRASQPSAVILDARVLQSTPESGDRAGYSGHKRRKGSKIHAAVDTLGYPLALTVTPASEDERTQVEALTAQVQAVTGEHIEIAYVDQGYTGPDPLASAAQHGIELVVVKTPQAKRGFVLLPKRWVVERSFAWMSRARRLARDCERLPQVLMGLHFLAFACLMLHQLIHLFSSS
jgi:transposase